MSMYNSSTMGLIKLSQQGRNLLQELRGELQIALQDARQDRGKGTVKWDPLSRARGNIAVRMSDLERDSDNQKHRISVLVEENRALRDEHSDKLTRTNSVPVAYAPAVPRPGIDSYSISELFAALSRKFA